MIRSHQELRSQHFTNRSHRELQSGYDIVNHTILVIIIVTPLFVTLALIRYIFIGIYTCLCRSRV